MDKIKPTREEILASINKLILEEHNNLLNETNLLIDSDMDSLGYIIFWLNLANDFSIVPSQNNLTEQDKNKLILKYINEIDYKNYTLKDLIDRIEKCM